MLPLKDFPGELLTQISKLLYCDERWNSTFPSPQHDLLNFRSVCGSFFLAERYLAFEKLFITLDGKGMEKLMQVAVCHIAPQVKDLIFRLDNGVAAALSDAARSENTAEGISWRTSRIEERKAGRYWLLTRKGYQILLLCLPRFSTLRSVRILSARFPCSFHVKDGRQEFRQIAEALIQSRHTIEALVLENAKPIHILHDNFGLSYRDALRNLRRLSTHISWQPDEENDWNSIVVLVQAAPLLEQLDINQTDSDGISNFSQNLWTQIDQSQIQTLYLEHINFEPASLLSFLTTRRPSLHVRISNPHISEGSWKPIFAALRGVPNFRWCYGDFYVGNIANIQLKGDDLWNIPSYIHGHIGSSAAWESLR